MTLSPIAVLFALPDESGDFRRMLAVESAVGRGVELGVRGKLGEAQVVVAHTGVGAARASRRAAEVIAEHRPGLIVSAGFAGGLQAVAGIGKVVVDARGGSLALPEGCLAGTIVSRDVVVEAASAKAALGRETGALAVDMETAAIAAAGEAAGLRVIAVRTISDPVDADMPVPMEVWFDQATQKPRVLALLGFLARNPGRIGAFARFVRGLGPARAALARVLAQVVQGAERSGVRAP